MTFGRLNDDTDRYANVQAYPALTAGRCSIVELAPKTMDGTPIREAARQLGIPKSTLFNRLKNPKLGLTLGTDVPVRHGREKFLQLDEEQVVVDWANTMAGWRSVTNPICSSTTFDWFTSFAGTSDNISSFDLKRLRLLAGSYAG
jgi:hypothetical protein